MAPLAEKYPTIKQRRYSIIWDEQAVALRLQSTIDLARLFMAMDGHGMSEYILHPQG